MRNDAITRMSQSPGNHRAGLPYDHIVPKPRRPQLVSDVLQRRWPECPGPDVAIPAEAQLSSFPSRRSSRPRRTWASRNPPQGLGSYPTTTSKIGCAPQSASCRKLRRVSARCCRLKPRTSLDSFERETAALRRPSPEGRQPNPTHPRAGVSSVEHPGAVS